MKCDDIARGIEEMGVDLDDHIAFVLGAMRGVKESWGRRILARSAGEVPQLRAGAVAKSLADRVACGYDTCSPSRGGAHVTIDARLRTVAAFLAAACAQPALAASAADGPSPFAAPFYIVGAFARPIVADYDGDGTPELVGVRDDSLLVFRQVRTGELAPVAGHPLGSSVLELLAGDFDDDGHSEPVVILPEDSTAVIHRGGVAPEVWSVPGHAVLATLLANPGPDAIAILLVGGTLVVLSEGQVTNTILLEPGLGLHLISGQFAGSAEADVVVSRADTLITYEWVPGDGFVRRGHTKPEFEIGFLRAGDLNGDGLTDAAVMWTERWDGYFERLVSAGDGTFTVVPRSPLPVVNHFPNPPTDLAVADLDRDGRSDLLAAYPCGECESSLWVMMASGERHFVARGGRFQHVTTGDIDGDGWLEVVGSNSHAGVGIVCSVEGRTFGHGKLLSGRYRPQELLMADLDGDTDLDAVITGYEGEFVVRRQEGGGAFAEAFLPWEWLESVRRVEAGDADGDGDTDLLLSSGAVALNDGAGGFASLESILPVQEVLVAGEEISGGSIEMLGASSGWLRVWRPQAPLAFGPADSVAIGAEARSITLLDVDGDGDREIVVVTNLPAESLLVVERDPGLRVAYRRATDQRTEWRGSHAYRANLDGNAAEDLVLDSGVSFVGQADGSVAVHRRFRPAPLAVGDWDGDGLDDLAISTPTTLEILINRNTSYELVQQPGVGENTRALGAGDFDQDGDTDLFVVTMGNYHTESGWITLLWNTLTDSPTSTLVAEAAAWREAGAVHLRWRIPGWAGAVVDIQRRSYTQAWQAVGRLRVDPHGVVSFADETAGTAGYTYAVDRGGERVGEIVIAAVVPSVAHLSFVNPMPAGRPAFRIEGITGKAMLELLDIAGRRVAVGVIEESESEIVLRPEPSLRPGVYFALLRQQERTLVSRRIVLTN